MRWIATLALTLALVAGAAAAQSLGGLARALPDASGAETTAKGVRLELALSQGVPWRVFTLSDPDRLVLDFREVDWSALAPEDFAAEGLGEVRFGAFREGWSRLVADLERPLGVAEAGLSVSDLTGTATLAVYLEPVSAAAFDAAAGAPQDPRWDLPQPAPVEPAPRSSGEPRPLRVVLDPGHGGIDPGAEAGAVNEAALMLTFARELRDVLRRAGFEVVLTRDADIFVSLERRVAIAHQAKADLFISLHADSLASGVAHGATVYTLSESASDAASAALAERHNRSDLLAGLDLAGTDDVVADVLMDLARLETQPRAESLARALVEGIAAATGHVNSRPLRSAGFSVLKAADIPSVLLEAGFLSTPEDLQRLQDPAWRAALAEGVWQGIGAWMAEDAAEAPLRRQ
ncbi:N-acetylmuramoyl-L-alanine amidase [Rhodosalinus halophilus]|uniref:N-acetylmuramoyl-L-alanine amidase n=1 Tax=Rhodosalinus halophilus TaxID=2259333 RepID=A0A365UCM2_9RHOB|nr:N-acetylmuramoyl-L-alanine amidase [Rhodosalinus halophilus]RBI87122.1 N-acetylmuramoyl-L-alanine amidase [Rhodosalinus halophilus]